MNTTPNPQPITEILKQQPMVTSRAHIAQRSPRHSVTRLLVSAVTNKVSTIVTALTRSVMSMRARSCIISKPTSTSAGAVACGGMMTKSGQKSRARQKKGRGGQRG